MNYKRCGRTFIVRLDPGDELMSSLKWLARDENIKFAHISGIGAVNHAVLGCYLTETRAYTTKNFDGNFEIVSLSGNVSRLDDEPLVHLHTILSTPDFETVGGHLYEAIVSVTAEIFVRVIDGAVTRQLNKEFGISFMQI